MNDLKLVLYLPTRPDLIKYEAKRVLRGLSIGEVPQVISLTGNHWRKIFSIFSKISHGLNPSKSETWQIYRDEVLLTSSGGEMITFSKKVIKSSGMCIHIITGKGHCEKFDLPFERFKKIDVESKILHYQSIYMTPYFDYRQFPNQLIEALVHHIQFNNN